MRKYYLTLQEVIAQQNQSDLFDIHDRFDMTPGIGWVILETLNTINVEAIETLIRFSL